MKSPSSLAALAALAALSTSATCLPLVGCGDGASSSPSTDSPDGALRAADGGTGALDDAALPSGDGANDAAITTGDASSGDASPLAWRPLPPTPQTPELWYWHHSYLSPTSTTEPAHSKGLIDQAAAAGYTGLAFWDSSLTFANRPSWDLSNLKTVVDYARSKGMSVLAGAAPYGYSNDMLQVDPNLAEGAPVVGGQFKVNAGATALTPINTLPPLTNGGFETGKSKWFGIGDARVDLDGSMAHTGSNSAVIHGGSSGNARLTQAMTLTPWRIYHVQLWSKTLAFSGNTLDVEILDFATQQNVTITRMGETVVTGSGGDTGWTVFDYAFNSQASTAVTLYLGVWGGFTGTVWVDDIAVEETALVNVLRRGGTPLKVYDSGATYTEDSDYAKVVDPALAAAPGTYDAWHTPPTVAVPGGSKLHANQVVSMDYYTVVPQIGWEVSSCLTEPAVQQWNHDNAVAQANVFPAGTGVFLGYDEMRQGDSCELCRSRNLAAGQLLAWNVEQTTQTLEAVWGTGTKFYFWDDMFNPFHNAVADYYDVEGDLTGSWQGLPPGTTIMQWNLADLANSLAFFSGTDARQPHAMQQIIAGYYDSGDGAKAASDELQAAMGIKGVVGLMYTSWKDDYSQLAAYATAAKSAWPSYRQSAP
jgi:hypothetical protein